MDDLAGLGLIAVFAGIFAGRFINERGMRSLTGDQKAQFLDAFSRQRQFSLLPLIAIAVLAVASPGQIPTWLWLSLLVLYIVASFLFALRKMRSIELPRGYIRTYAASQAVQIGGLLFYFATLQGWMR